MVVVDQFPSENSDPRVESAPRSTESPIPDHIVHSSARGWRLFPVQGCGKKPLIADWPNKATEDQHHLTTWAKQFPGCNWGMATGAGSGVFVLDVDGEHRLQSILQFEQAGRRLPRTLTANTGKGSHLYFRWPESGEIRNSASKLGSGLDIRATGGYVVVPPSVHPSGNVYEFVDESVPIAEAPEWLLEQLLIPKSQSLSEVIEADVDVIRPGQEFKASPEQCGAVAWCSKKLKQHYKR
ncbi:MAG TPA: bifunctional DNA primase/polymerase [Terriglobales bacterium]|nr:bifunctional DNA primase/polymerase [Terriglobales bacterium]